MKNRKDLKLAAEIESALETLESAAAMLAGQPPALQFDGEEDDEEYDDDAEFDFGDESFDLADGSAIVELSDDTKAALSKSINSRINDLKTALKNMGIDD